VVAVVASILLAGGGTAGHVNPLLAIAGEVRHRYPDASVRVLGTKEGLEARLVPQAGFTLDFVPKVPLPRRPSSQWMSLPGNLRRAVQAAHDVMSDQKPDIVMGFGGYVSTPAYLAARQLGIPVVIHEQNARPGLANKLGARFAAQVLVTFESTQLPGAVPVGLPLRADLGALAVASPQALAHTRLEAAERFGLSPHVPTLLVTGGSLGAVSLNRAVSGAAKALLAAGAQVLHVTGKDKSQAVIEQLDGIDDKDRGRYVVVEYMDRMDLAYAASDLVMCRAGAGTVCELAALGIPAVFVPLPIGNGEQRLNAQPLVHAGGALLVADEDVSSDWVEASLPGLLRDAARLARMRDAAKSVGHPGATAHIVDRLESLAGWRQ
jgi:undecaprenyldiphospho-muramoylpentapeptide beta-N-acetylglucosaminyltransferase